MEGLETSVGLNVEQVGKGGGRHDDHVCVDCCCRLHDVAASGDKHNKGGLLGEYGLEWAEMPGIPVKGKLGALFLCCEYRPGAKNARFSEKVLMWPRGGSVELHPKAIECPESQAPCWAV